ncbi:flavin reductase family protein [Actinocorallia populi]|uniref:flavin reductase family protein n=1 Tax=Actinocorallia populi TaxID=2079200 RepID=UPI000D096205|nr:flavin reductase family protein [Actinocorallia populi]
MGNDPIDQFTSGFDGPVLLVTTSADGERAGCLVGFATQCSIDPVRFLVCLSRTNRTFRVAAKAELLGVHVLERDDPGQLALARLFGENTGDEMDKFARCAWEEDTGGVPLLLDAPRRMVGRVLDRMELGDHTGYLVEPLHVQAKGRNAPLGLTRVLHLEAGHPA